MKTAPVDSIHYEIVKLKTGDLRKGMFVCELDRPWSEVPFPPEGFEIETDADLEAVRKHCAYVYIDLGRTQVVRLKIDTTRQNPFFDGGPRTSMGREMAAAGATRQETSNLVQSLHDEIRVGHGVDGGQAKSAVSQCVASILRNPDAMLFMTQMREKSPHTSTHAFNVCIYSIILGRLSGLDARQLEELGTCGLLHDIGNIEIPEHILDKTTALGAEEFEIIKQHTSYGRDILAAARNIPPAAAEVAHSHHECPDGSGYPRGLDDSRIDLYTRIVSVVDKYAAITQDASYKTAQNHLEAVNIMNLLADQGKIDKALCSVFVGYLGFYPPGTIVELSSGEVGLVLKSNLQNRLRPQLLVVRDTDKSPVERFVDLAEKPYDVKGKPYKIKMVHLPGYLGIDLFQYQNALISAYD